MLIACNPVEEIWNKGTTAGFASCMARGKAQGLSEFTSNTACIAKHEKPIVVEFKGSGSINRSVGSFSFMGTGKNPSKKYIITGFTVTVRINENDKLEIKQFDEYWVTPHEMAVFFVPLPGIQGSDPDIYADKSKWDWSINNFKGIEISL